MIELSASGDEVLDEALLMMASLEAGKCIVLTSLLCPTGPIVAAKSSKISRLGWCPWCSSPVSVSVMHSGGRCVTICPVFPAREEDEGIVHTRTCSVSLPQVLADRHAKK